MFLRWLRAMQCQSYTSLPYALCADVDFMAFVARSSSALQHAKLAVEVFIAGYI